MIIDLNRKESLSTLQFDIGDVIVFYNGETYDYYNAIFDGYSREYKLLSLKDSRVYEKWDNLSNMIYCLNHNIKNDYKLIEVLKPDEVVIRRVANE